MLDDRRDERGAVEADDDGRVRHVAVPVRLIGHREAFVALGGQRLRNGLGRVSAVGDGVEHHHRRVVLAEAEAIGVAVKRGAIAGQKILHRGRLGGDGGRTGLGANALDLGGVEERDSGRLREPGPGDDRQMVVHRGGGFQEQRSGATVQLQQQRVGTSRGGLRDHRLHVLHADIQSVFVDRLDVGGGERLDDFGMAALAVGGGLVDHRGLLDVERINCVMHLSALHDAVGREEAEDVGVAFASDVGGARHSGERHLLRQRDRHHRKHLRAEHGGDDGGDAAVG